jgi:hypothetical protein
MKRRRLGNRDGWTVVIGGSEKMEGRDHGG